MSINGLSRINNTTWTDIIQLLQQDWNPEQISLWLKTERSVSISHEWIYPFLLQDKLSDGPLYLHLPLSNITIPPFSKKGSKLQALHQIAHPAGKHCTP